MGETINNIYKRFSGHKTTITKEKSNNYLVQHCNNGTCSVSNLTITILENLEVENFTKEEKIINYADKKSIGSMLWVPCILLG